MMMPQQEILDFFSESADTYQFLSTMLFKELNEEAIEELSTACFPTDTGNKHLDQGYRMVRRYFAFSATDRRGQLACEYARIFLAAGACTKDQTTAVPYESVFTSDEHIMMQAARDDVVARYRADGFLVNPQLHEPEDHLAFELEYLSSMNEQAHKWAQEKNVTELSRNVSQQREFIDLHLLNWIPTLREVAQEYAKLSFYTGMLHIAQGMLEEGRDMLCEVQKLLENTCNEPSRTVHERK